MPGWPPTLINEAPKLQGNAQTFRFLGIPVFTASEYGTKRQQGPRNNASAVLATLSNALGVARFSAPLHGATNFYTGFSCFDPLSKATGGPYQAGTVETHAVTTRPRLFREGSGKDGRSGAVLSARSSRIEADSMESSSQQAHLPAKKSAAVRPQGEGVADKSTGESSRLQVPASTAAGSTERFQPPLLVRLRRAGPGAHFQPPPLSPRSHLAQRNRLFAVSTVQPRPQRAQGNLGQAKAFSGMRRADACVCPDWLLESPPDDSPGGSRESGAAHAEASEVAASQEGGGRQAAGECSRNFLNRLASPQTRASSSNEPLLPAAVYLKAFERLKEETSGKRVVTGARSADLPMRGAPPLKIFCGTWNCQYQDFPVNVLVNRRTASRLQQELDSPVLAANPSRLVSSSADVPETLPEEVPTEVIEKLDGDFDALCEPDAPLEQQRPGPALQISSAGGVSAPFSRKATISRGDLVRSSTRRLRAVEGEDQPFADWVLPGYDVYIVSLQETLGQTIFEAITVYLTTVNGMPFKRIRFQEDRLSGLGDGAWMQFKSTSFLSGSKGGVSVCLKIWNQFFCFIGCHMPSTSPEDRRKARSVVEQRLLEFYGGASCWREAFHHVLWMGDFNFRTQRVTTQRADVSRPDWVDEEYQTRMVTQWYKGSRQQDRIPSGCMFIFAAAFLIASDHSPVGLGLECFPLDTAYLLPPVTSDTSPSKPPVAAAGPKDMEPSETLSRSMFLTG
ncbi:hypothetical protein ACSSS7_002519 [Eimeria intestinalis]